MTDLRGSEGEWVRVLEGAGYLNAQIVSVDEATGRVGVRLADGSVETFHWSRVRLSSDAARSRGSG